VAPGSSTGKQAVKDGARHASTTPKIEDAIEQGLARVNAEGTIVREGGAV
jgi:hypothetical protein